jgi:HK97 family phage major capsid protein
MPELKDLLSEKEDLVKQGSALIEKYGDGPIEDAEDRKTLRSQAKKLEELEAQIADQTGDEQAKAAFRAAKQEGEERERIARERARPAVHGKGDAPDPKDPSEGMTPGEAFVSSAAYRGWMDRFPSGRPEGHPISISSEPVVLRHFRHALGMLEGSERARSARALVTSADASAGTLVRPDYRGLLEPGIGRQLTIRQLVTVIGTQSDAIEYVKELSRTSGAAPVAEATALTGTTGTKPEAGLTFELVTDTIKTIAVWVPATKRIVSDASGLRAYIDAFLTQDLGEELEDQIISGSGSGENFRGILNTTGVEDVGSPGAGQSVLDTIRLAKGRVKRLGKTDATAVVLNPEDSETIDLLKVNSEDNHFVGPGPFSAVQPSLWGLPRVESDGIPQGTFLVGDFRKAVLFDREATSISVGTVNDDFIRNIVRVLAELRAGFGVIRPKAFAKGTVP